MRGFILEIVIFTLISMFCLNLFGQNWQDEQHVWNEETGEWEVNNKAHGRVNDAPESVQAIRTRPYDDVPWGRYLPKNVRYGKRPPTSWELSEAQRKLWAKEIRTVRAMQESERRRQLIAHRKATGWYAARRSGGYNPGYNTMLMMHMQSVNNYVNGGGYRRGY